jgi:hypothetical protein
MTTTQDIRERWGKIKNIPWTLTIEKWDTEGIPREHLVIRDGSHALIAFNTYPEWEERAAAGKAIASAPTDITHLLEENERLREERDGFRESLRQLSGVIARDTDCPFCLCHANLDGWEHTSDCPLPHSTLEDS